MVEDLRDARPEDVQATFCATLVDTWIDAGVGHAVVAPGSRSTPMALAIAARPELAVHVVHDERVAAFVALGIGSAGRGPALLLCTSGTAAANFLPAVVEAGLSEIPMLVLTADRPEELRGVGAPQTIDQIELYGRHVRWFHDPGVPAADAAGGWRRLAHEAWVRTRRGPVQLNLPFREPLVGTPRPLPAETAASGSDRAESGPAASAVDPAWDVARGVILAGGRSGVAPEAVAELHRLTEWPILADPTSGMRHLDGVVTTADAVLRHERFADDHAPDVIVRIGRPAASKVLSQWSARPGLTLVQVGGPGRIDPARNVSAVTTIDALLAHDWTGARGTPWLARWRRAEERARRAIDEVLEGRPELTEPAVARLVARLLPGDADLVVSSSMPVRDLEWYGGPAAHAWANRGANGIDGVVSTAVGRALAHPGRPTFVLIGDLALAHDANALLALPRRGVDLRIVVVDNDGGGIFSFLPQAGALPSERFEQLFGTPHGTDLVGLAAAHGVDAVSVATADELTAALSVPGPGVVRVATDRAANVAVHADLHAAVASAL